MNHGLNRVRQAPPCFDDGLIEGSVVDDVLYIAVLQSQSRQLVVGWDFQEGDVPTFHDRSFCGMIDTVGFVVWAKPTKVALPCFASKLGPACLDAQKHPGPDRS